MILNANRLLKGSRTNESIAVEKQVGGVAWGCKVCSTADMFNKRFIQVKTEKQQGLSHACCWVSNLRDARVQSRVTQATTIISSASLDRLSDVRQTHSSVIHYGVCATYQV